MSHVHGVVRREGMGFKAMPWMLYYKPSLGEFVIRQRHTVHRSERVKRINQIFKDYRQSIAPGARARALRASSGHVVYIYRNGQAIEHVASDINTFRSMLSEQLAATFRAEEGKGLKILKRNPVHETERGGVPILMPEAAATA